MLPSACGKDLSRFVRRRSNSEYLAGLLVIMECCVDVGGVVG